MFPDPINFNLETNDEKNDFFFTIMHSSVGAGRYVFQTRCPSDFAQIELELEPYSGESHFLLDWRVTEEQIPKFLQSGVIAGIRHASVQKYSVDGMLVQIKVNVVNGRYHPVDSCERSLREATKWAFEDAIKKNKIVPFVRK